MSKRRGAKVARESGEYDPLRDPRLVKMDPNVPLARSGVIYSIVVDTGTGRSQASVGVVGPEGFDALMNSVVMKIATDLGFEVTWKKKSGTKPGANPAQRF